MYEKIVIYLEIYSILEKIEWIDKQLKKYIKSISKRNLRKIFKDCSKIEILKMRISGLNLIYEYCLIFKQYCLDKINEIKELI